jgi:hypothetical protein
MLALTLALAACGGEDGPALSGPMMHDFGVADFTGPDMVLEHAFDLTNASSGTVSIDRLTSSCGCVKPTADAMTIEAGASVRIGAAMKVAAPGRTLEHITIILAGGREPVRLELRADVRLVRTLVAMEPAIALDAAGAGALTLRAETSAPGWPPDGPWWEPVEGMAIEFDGWRVVEGDDVSAKAVWEGILRVKRNGPSPPDATLLIRVGTHHELRVKLD